MLSQWSTPSQLVAVHAHRSQPLVCFVILRTGYVLPWGSLNQRFQWFGSPNAASGSSPVLQREGLVSDHSSTAQQPIYRHHEVHYQPLFRITSSIYWPNRFGFLKSMVNFTNKQQHHAFFLDPAMAPSKLLDHQLVEIRKDAGEIQLFMGTVTDGWVVHLYETDGSTNQPTNQHPC